ncbi:MAG: ribonucleotide reductase subunit alpha [Polyangiaceae bacterium]|nr:ribonucleotide reductase subunit alpha [Polyangiaceae bacterium]
MRISSFEGLLEAARNQPERQRLLLVFTKAELPEGASPEEVERFERGLGGALTPVMFVDKAAEELESFAELVAESVETGRSWEVVFVGCLGGPGPRGPSEEETERTLEAMVESIQRGAVTRFIAFRRDGEPLQLS